MNVNGSFRDDELVLRRQKINGEWVESYFPKVGGRLRVAHEQNERLGIQTEVIRFDETCAVVKATVTTMKGSFCGFGTASAQRDQRLVDSLLELAETRSIARSLRFGGYGVEYVGAEEMSHVMPDTEPPAPSNESKDQKPVFGPEENRGKQESKAPVQPKNGNGGKATGAQCRALYALSKKAKICDEDLDGLLRPLQADRFEDLTLSDASRLIQYFQTQVAA